MGFHYSNLRPNSYIFGTFIVLYNHNKTNMRDTAKTSCVKNKDPRDPSLFFNFCFVFA